MTARAQEIRTGLAWLHAADPALAQVIDGSPDFDPDIWMRRLPAMDLFGALVFQIIGQQISVIAATAISRASPSGSAVGCRMPAGRGCRPRDIAWSRSVPAQGRHRPGFGAALQRWAPVRGRARELPDQEVIRRLTEVKGIGAWTVQGALLIALQRPDVIRTDDLALRHSIQARYGLDHLPDPAEVADLAQHWRPYRSLASSLLLAAARSS